MTDLKTNEQGMIPEQMPEYISYKDGFRYQFIKDYCVFIDICHYKDIEADFLSLTRHGLLVIKKGYAWDGPSGPTKVIADILTILTLLPFIGRFFNWLRFKLLNSFMRGSAIHDALYDFLRKGLLPADARLPADRELRKACLKDGMHKIRADYVYKGVRDFAEYAADPENKKRVYHAPEVK